MRLFVSLCVIAACILGVYGGLLWVQKQSAVHSWPVEVWVDGGEMWTVPQEGQPFSGVVTQDSQFIYFTPRITCALSSDKKTIRCKAIDGMPR